MSGHESYMSSHSSTKQNEEKLTYIVFTSFATWIGKPHRGFNKASPQKMWKLKHIRSLRAQVGQIERQLIHSLNWWWNINIITHPRGSQDRTSCLILCVYVSIEGSVWNFIITYTWGINQDKAKAYAVDTKIKVSLMTRLSSWQKLALSFHTNVLCIVTVARHIAWFSRKRGVYLVTFLDVDLLGLQSLEDWYSLHTGNWPACLRIHLWLVFERKTS